MQPVPPAMHRMQSGQSEWLAESFECTPNGSSGMRSATRLFFFALCFNFLAWQAGLV
jgi:hypothetical protein